MLTVEPVDSRVYTAKAKSGNRCGRLLEWKERSSRGIQRDFIRPSRRMVIVWLTMELFENIELNTCHFYSVWVRLSFEWKIHLLLVIRRYSSNVFPVRRIRNAIARRKRALLLDSVGFWALDFSFPHRLHRCGLLWGISPSLKLVWSFFVSLERNFMFRTRWIGRLTMYFKKRERNWSHPLLKKRNFKFWIRWIGRLIIMETKLDALSKTQF